MNAPEIKKELRLLYESLKGKDDSEAIRLRVMILSELRRLLELEKGIKKP